MIKKLYEITSNITDGKHGDCEPDKNSKCYFISAKDINEFGINYFGARRITKDSYIESHQRTQLAINDILITNSGTIGKMCIVRNIPYETTFQKSVAIIKPKSDVIIPRFLFYYLLGNKNKLINLANGSTQKNLLLKDIRSFEVDVPSFIEQQHIVNIIGSIDDLIENLNQTKDKLHSFVSFKLRKEDKYFVELGDYIEVYDNFRKPLSSISRNTDKIYPYYGATGILDYIDDYIFDGEYVLMAEDGSVITDNGNPIIQFIDGKSWVGNHAHVLRTKNNLSLYSLYFILKDTNVKNAITGAVQMKINQANMKKIIIAIPKNITYFNTISNDIMMKIKIIDKKVKMLYQIKQKYLNKFFG